jgi:hypothetical protein
MSRYCTPARFEKTLRASGARLRINGFSVHKTPQKSCAMRIRDRSCDVPPSIVFRQHGLWGSSRQLRFGLHTPGNNYGVMERDHE